MDSDFADDLDKRRSTSCIFTISNVSVSWNFQLQKIVDLSSIEAEYITCDVVKKGPLDKEIVMENGFYW